MKQTTALGLAAAFVMLLLGVIMEGGNPAAFINIPAFLIVIGGTVGAVMASLSMEELKTMPKTAILAVKGEGPDAAAEVRRMVALAEKARREGLLALESDLDELDGFSRRGLQLVVDGADSDVVHTILGSEMDGIAERHARHAKSFATAGGFAPTLGILGTVMSLVHVLENLDDPSSLGHSIAGAFIATLYGVGSANLIFLPIGNRLKGLSEHEAGFRELQLAAILAIQAGDNPRLLAEKLEAFLPPEERGKEPAKASSRSSASVSAEPVGEGA
jgi:chemotaxis protein MotA